MLGPQIEFLFKLISSYKKQNNILTGNDTSHTVKAYLRTVLLPVAHKAYLHVHHSRRNLFTRKLLAVEPAIYIVILSIAQASLQKLYELSTHTALPIYLNKPLV